MSPPHFQSIRRPWPQAGVARGCSGSRPVAALGRGCLWLLWPFQYTRKTSLKWSLTEMQPPHWLRAPKDDFAKTSFGYWNTPWACGCSGSGCVGHPCVLRYRICKTVEHPCFWGTVYHEGFWTSPFHLFHEYTDRITISCDRPCFGVTKLRGFTCGCADCMRCEPRYWQWTRGGGWVGYGNIPRWDTQVYSWSGKGRNRH